MTCSIHQLSLAHGIRGLPGPFDTCHCRFRLAMHRSGAFPRVSGSPQLGQKRSSLLLQQNAGPRISYTGLCYLVFLSCTTVWHRWGPEGSNIAAFQPTQQTGFSKTLAETGMQSWFPQSCPEGQHFSRQGSRNKVWKDINEQGTAGHGRKVYLGWSLTHHVVHTDLTKWTASLLHCIIHTTLISKLHKVKTKRCTFEQILDYYW